MSRLCVSAAALSGTAFVILATSCTNDFDELFEGDASSDAGGKDTGPGDPCAPLVQKSGDGNFTKFNCPTCASTCPKILCSKDSTDGCTGTCEKGTTCDVVCSPGKCTLSCAAGASCVLRCSSGVPCDITDCSGEKETCKDGTIVLCDAKCPS